MTTPTPPTTRRFPFLLLSLSLAGSVLGSTGVQEPDDKPTDAAWDVSASHGPSRDVTFTTDEGTWLSLDVSPDGSTIAFSLLGDLYLLPIEGGEARRITSGPAYDVEPRFGPDGQRIAFASDRGGTENLWLCDTEGANLHQVSSETSTFVNGPAWSPDGDYLVGRKRLTDVSSLGTVELWMYHVRGGEGLQVTKKDEQPDAADAVFSPDGRFLYFSARDSRYRYDRNVYEGIWQIKRLDRVTGQTVPVTGEYGGAAAPELSPDGETMALVRRDRAETVLDLMDLATGRMRRLASGLERDLQEGFAFHGVFPGYAWTPDGRAIVATAGGKIWRWDVASGARTPIPFTATVEQRVTDALRFQPDVASEQFRARILRWPVESPDGTRLIFSALGHLYVMDLPQGTPRRLTDADELEYAPTFSPDGSRLAWVTWNDAEGGHVWVQAADGTGEPARVTASPGQYVNPAFSPDGERLVYVKGSGAAFRDHDLAEELWHEIYWVDVATGASHYVLGTKNRGTNRPVTRPQFSSDGERLYYIENDPEEKPFEVPKTVLVSVKLDGTDRKTHLRWQRADEAVVSPDGRWVVFNELHNAWLTALPPLESQTVDIDLESPALPLVKLTDEGGRWVSWADGGRAVAWIFGSTYRRLPLDEALANLGAEKADLPDASAVDIRLVVPRAHPTETVAYRGARIITMNGDEVLDSGTVVVRGNRIESVGPEGSTPIPPEARVVELDGKTVIPGLFDEHAHLHYSTLDVFPQRPWKYLANLAYGVTATHDPSASTEEVFGQSEMVEAGLMTGPRIYSTGFILYGADNPERAIVESLDDARRHVRRLKSLGAFSVKSYMQPRREQRQWIIQAAREEHMMVVPEGGGDLEADMTMVLDGHTTVEHALPVELRKDVVTLLAESDTAYTPTLLVAYGGLSGEHWFYQHADVWKDEKLLRYTPRGLLDARSRIRPIMAPDDEWHHLTVAASANRVEEAGGTVCLGGHGQLQGLGPHWEIWAYVQAGMSPHEALRVATLNPARALGLDGLLGSIEAGKLADFVVLDENPLERIENTDSVALVVKNGVAYDPEELARYVPERSPGFD